MRSVFLAGDFVLNQEFYHQMPNEWLYSFALSYRRQDEYSEISPFEHENPTLKQEFRLYGRFPYFFHFSPLSISFTLTPATDRSLKVY
ncbi:MAG: hypothetical protein NVV82_13255 [Sporocytophaga sp.]|nr:hypothetical protein [Sporocytophaga sp.]